jgi:hypothetical protein
MVDKNLTGYLHPAYALSLREFGEPIQLEGSGAWILKRAIPDTPYYDAMGLYPLTFCDWSMLQSDLGLRGDIISIVMVSEPFAFSHMDHFDFLKRYKTHRIVDTDSIKISKHHRYYTRKALEDTKVEILVDPLMYLDEWCSLYDGLIERHSITGIQAFSRDAFAMQFNVPGLVALRAYHRRETVAMHLWYIQGNVAYSHLAASSTRGYELSAHYALMDTSIALLQNDVRYIDLGGSPDGDGGNGLDFFKRGWANSTLPTQLCGAILQPSIYEDLINEPTDYFPAYRC